VPRNEKSFPEAEAPSPEVFLPSFFRNHPENIKMQIRQAKIENKIQKPELEINFPIDLPAETGSHNKIRETLLS
jgi:hypothetical protein